MDGGRGPSIILENPEFEKTRRQVKKIQRYIGISHDL